MGWITVLLNGVRGLLPHSRNRREEGVAAPSAAAAYWDQWQHEWNSRLQREGGAACPWVDWADHPHTLGLVLEKVFGPGKRDLFASLAELVPDLKTGHALSICCGNGEFESQLLAAGVVGRITGIDLSPVRITQAMAMNSQALHFIVGDVNEGEFGDGLYDAVIAKAALHHIADLETALKGARKALRPDGCLIAIDFFGPTRFQWTDAQIRFANEFLENEIPEELRKTSDGGLHSVVRPTIEEMIRMDPSEAVRSEEIEQVVRSIFPEVELRDAGGTLLNLIFSNIVNNFEVGNPSHDGIIERAFRLEWQLMETGVIGSDFKFMIARP